MLIYAIRHGQTDWNVEGRLQGARDVPLNAHGQRQARDNGRLLARLAGASIDDFDFVASPLGRTRHTMEIIRGELGLDPHDYRTDQRLIEVCFGDWEGRTLAEIDADTPGLVAARDRDKWFYRPPGASAENYEMLSKRVAGWLETVQTPTVCVCHGGVLRALFRIVGGHEPNDAALLPAHQDSIVRIAEGRIGWVEDKPPGGDVS
ncbi:histidine phosphatase family protein [Pararhizobium haloflavum]|uniref:histidine phosphatase family protein n=1 Tax=Pararhizobium haloflavum TaxID=2037914 RepID=UPI000C17FC19|nr:histidine phosphatase family protein [Pararhizobium haloflavum]